MINLIKANYMVSRPLQRRQTLDLSMKIDNNNIECLKETVFQEISSINICHGSLTFVAFLEKYLNLQALFTDLCKSSFCLPLKQSILPFYVFQCGDRHVTLRRIIILQKKIIRIISKVSLDSHNDVFFEEQEILKFSDIYTKQVNASF